MMFRFSQLFWIAVIALAIGISYLGAYECYKDAEKARALLCPKCVAAVSASPDSILNAPDPGDSLKKLVLLAIAAVLGIIFILGFEASWGVARQLKAGWLLAGTIAIAWPILAFAFLLSTAVQWLNIQVVDPVIFAACGRHTAPAHQRRSPANETAQPMEGD